MNFEIASLAQLSEPTPSCEVSIWRGYLPVTRTIVAEGVPQRVLMPLEVFRAYESVRNLFTDIEVWTTSDEKSVLLLVGVNYGRGPKGVWVIARWELQNKKLVTLDEVKAKLRRKVQYDQIFRRGFVACTVLLCLNLGVLIAHQLIVQPPTWLATTSMLVAMLALVLFTWFKWFGRQSRLWARWGDSILYACTEHDYSFGAQPA
jgi:hypothetical protein